MTISPDAFRMTDGDKQIIRCLKAWMIPVTVRTIDTALQWSGGPDVVEHRLNLLLDAGKVKKHADGKWSL